MNIPPDNQTPEDEGLTGYLVALAFLLLTCAGFFAALVQKAAHK